MRQRQQQSLFQRVPFERSHICILQNAFAAMSYHHASWADRRNFAATIAEKRTANGTSEPMVHKGDETFLKAQRNQIIPAPILATYPYLF
jgi:hypothetical protein